MAVTGLSTALCSPSRNWENIFQPQAPAVEKSFSSLTVCSLEEEFEHLVRKTSQHSLVSLSPVLVGSDAIIRQHKAACLRITALLACKDLLWIGTSAGVVLTLAIPPVSSSTAPGSLRGPLQPMGSAHGHTGHVRFLTSIELPEGFDVNFPQQADTGRYWSASTGASALLPSSAHWGLLWPLGLHHSVPRNVGVSVAFETTLQPGNLGFRQHI